MTRLEDDQMATSLAKVFVGVVALLTACGGSSPSALSPTGTVGARIDSGCTGRRVATVQVTVDGRISGTAEPGGAVSKVLPVGHHIISGLANLRPGFSAIVWDSGTVVTTAANPDSFRFLACL